MSNELLFSVCTYIAMTGWGILIFFPAWKRGARFISGWLLPFMFSILYLFLIVQQFGASEGGFGSLAGVSKLFENQTMLLVGWIHYLAFDLFIGSWQVRDASALEINHLLVVPCLILTFLFGPIGLGLYLLIRWAIKNQLALT